MGALGARIGILLSTTCIDMNLSVFGQRLCRRLAVRLSGALQELTGQLCQCSHDQIEKVVTSAGIFPRFAHLPGLPLLPWPKVCGMNPCSLPLMGLMAIPATEGH
jgi:hypothetical protein